MLDTKYDNEQIYVQSTDVERTLMSAESNLAGLYEPVGDDVWNAQIKWQPIPVHTVPEKEDAVKLSQYYNEILLYLMYYNMPLQIVAAKAPCPAFDYYLENFMNSEKYRSLLARYKNLFDYLSNNSGRAVQTFIDAQYLNNTLFIETLYNRTLPVWAQKVYGSPDLTFISNFAFSINTHTRKLARLKTGPLLKDVLNRFEIKHKKQLKPDRNVFIYSAHDTTVANLLNTLKLFQVYPYTISSCTLGSKCRMYTSRAYFHSYAFLLIYPFS